MDMSTNKQLRPFGMRDKVGYAFGDFGCNMSFAFINSYLMLFYVTCMKIDPKHFAVLILLGKIFDAINDPIIGGLCDATKPGKDGKFKPWIKWASPVLLLSSIALFIYAPSAPYGVKIAMCLGIYCLWSVAYTSVNVPYGSMQSCITNDPAGRSSLSQWRSIGAMCAQIPIMILLPLLVYDKNDNPRGELFIIFVGVMGAIGLVSFYLLRRMTTERIAAAQPQEKQKFNYFATLGSFFKNKPMMGVTISTVAYLALMMTVTTSMPYIFMCYFQNTKLITIATMLAGCPVALGILLVKPMLKKFTKSNCAPIPLSCRPSLPAWLPLCGSVTPMFGSYWWPSPCLALLLPDLDVGAGGRLHRLPGAPDRPPGGKLHLRHLFPVPQNCPGCRRRRSQLGHRHDRL